MDSKKVNGVEITAKKWEKGDKHRIYFGGNGGQACWDAIANEWVKIHHEFGPQFKLQIKRAFDLPLSEYERSYLQRIGLL